MDEIAKGKFIGELEQLCLKHGMMPVQIEEADDDWSAFHVLVFKPETLAQALEEMRLTPLTFDLGSD